MTHRQRGRKNKAAPRIIHHMVNAYPEEETLSEIAGHLKLETNVVNYNLSRVLMPNRYVIKNAHTKRHLVSDRACVDIMWRYFYTDHGVPDGENMVSFLTSEYANRVLLSTMGFNALVSRAQIKWLMMHGPKRLQELHDSLPQASVQMGGKLGALLNQYRSLIPILIRHYDLGTPLDQVNQEMRLRFPDLNPTKEEAAAGFPNPWFEEDETKDLCEFVRFAPSLITYIFTDNVHQGIPTDFLLEPLTPSQIDGKGRKELMRYVKGSFRRFYCTLIASFAVHDIATYDFLSDPRLLSKSGIQGRKDPFSFNHVMRTYRREIRPNS